MAEQGAWAAMAEQGTREAMAGPPSSTWPQPPPQPLLPEPNYLPKTFLGESRGSIRQACRSHDFDTLLSHDFGLQYTDFKKLFYEFKKQSEKELK